MSIASMQRLAAPSEPRDSQRLAAAAAGLIKGLRTSHDQVGLVHVELGGRGLFELYFALGLTIRRTRPALVLTCHDPPSLVGASMLFTVLDKRPWRRLGMLLSNTLGMRCEDRVLARAAGVIALTHQGANTLAMRVGREVSWIPLIITGGDRSALSRNTPIVFVPGYVNDAARIVDLVRALPPCTLDQPSWLLTVGAGGKELERHVRTSIESHEQERVRFLGYMSEPDLDKHFCEATIVVRLHNAGGHNGNPLAASGPLGWALAHGCICVTNDDRAGARDLESAGLVLRTSEPARALAELLRRPIADGEHERIFDAAQRFAGVPVVARQYRAVLANAGIADMTDSAAER